MIGMAFICGGAINVMDVIFIVVGGGFMDNCWEGLGEFFVLEGYLKLWNQPDDSGVPSSRHIIQDVTKVLNEAWPAIYKNCGRACHDFCSRNGRRNAIKVKDKDHTGGHTVKIEHFGVLDDFIHPSVTNHEIDHFKKSLRIFEGFSYDEENENNSDKEN